MMRILIAEDEIYSAMALQQLLAGRGAEVSLAYDGEQALELYHSHDYDLALLDADMPHMDGYQVATAIRADESELKANKPLLLVHFSGYRLTEDELVGRGFDAQLQKPLTDPDELYQLIDQLLGSMQTPQAQA